MDLPPTAAGPRASREDEQHLQVLAIFYYVYGGLVSVGGCFSLLYIFVGVVLAASGVETDPGDPPAGVIGGFIVLIGGCSFLILAAFAALYFATGYFLQSQRYRVFCMIVAGITCLSIPLGTILGVFTLVVLSRASVVELFERKRAELESRLYQ